MPCSSSNAFADGPISVTLQNHKFIPNVIHVKANQPSVIALTNKDAQAEEFDSTSLKVEKVVAGNSTGNVRLRALAPQEQQELHTKGRLVVEDVSGPALAAGLEAGDVVLGVNGTGVSTVAALEDGKVETFEILAEEIGLPRARIEDLRGGAPPHNARLMRDLLAGTGGPLRDIVLLNSGAALLVAGRVDTLESGIELAARSLDTGAARRVLQDLVATTNAPAGAEAAAG